MKNCDQEPDVDIIGSITNGNPAAFEILIGRHASCLHKIGHSFGYRHEDTEDLVQETLISAYDHLKALRNSAYFKTWISRIMLNACYRKLRALTFQRKIKSDLILHQAVTDLSANLNHDADKTVTREPEFSNQQRCSKYPGML
jgi:RNA polymerase sigma factor (sigma-70 family)